MENGFTTNLYRKKTFTGLYAHFDSLSPVQYKINLSSVLIYRAFHTFLSYKAFHSQICNIKRFLQQNRFPAQLIDRIIKSFLNKQYVVDIKPSNVPKLPILLFLPYLGVYSIHLKKRLTKFIGKFYPHVDLKIVFRANKPIGRLFPLKIVSLVTFAPLLFTSLRVVAARLLTMAKHHAISFFAVESI